MRVLSSDRGGGYWGNFGLFEKLGYCGDHSA